MSRMSRTPPDLEVCYTTAACATRRTRSRLLHDFICAPSDALLAHRRHDAAHRRLIFALSLGPPPLGAVSTFYSTARSPILLALFFPHATTLRFSREPFDFGACSRAPARRASSSAVSADLVGRKSRSYHDRRRAFDGARRRAADLFPDRIWAPIPVSLRLAPASPSRANTAARRPTSPRAAPSCKRGYYTSWIQTTRRSFFSVVGRHPACGSFGDSFSPGWRCRS